MNPPTATTVRLVDLAQYLGTLGAAYSPAKLDMTRPLRPVSVYLASQAKMNFDRASTPDGAPWPPLKRQRPRNKRAAKAGKRKGKHSGQKPLRDSGILMASMSARAATAGAVRAITGGAGRANLEQGSNVDYGGYHQFGTRHIPKREFSGITDAMVGRIGDIVVDDLVRQMGGR